MSNKVKWLNNQPWIIADSYETKYENINVTIDVAARDPGMQGTGDINIKKNHWLNNECKRTVNKQYKLRMKIFSLF